MTSNDLAVLIANWTGPYSWPGFEPHNNLPPLTKVFGVYLQTFEYENGYLIYCAGHAKNIKKRFGAHEKNRRIGNDVNIFDVDQMKRGKRKLVWNGFTDWWTNNSDLKNLQERELALGYPPQWGEDIPFYETRKAVAFGTHWRSVIDASIRQCSQFRLFVAAFGPDDRLRKRLEAGIMDSLYSAPPPFCDIPDKGMALSKRDAESGETPVTVENRAAALLYALPHRLII